MTANLCGLCERPLFGRASTAYLCPGCAESTAERLGELRAMYGLLEEMLLPDAQREPRGTRSAVSPALVVLDVADARAHMATVLGSWHRALFQDLEWEAPPLIEQQAERVTAAVKALLANVTWIASDWPAAGDFAREIRTLHRDAASVIGTDERGTRMGLCPTLVDGVLCGAPLRLPPKAKVVTCGWCDSSYPDGVWPLLRLAQEAVFEAKPTESKAS